MVDFNSEGTVATPASDIVRILILQARYNAGEAIESYLKQKSQGIQPDTSIIQSRIWRLWSELSSGMMRRAKKDKKDELEFLDESLQSNTLSYEKLMDIFKLLNKELDDLKLTAIDTRELFDSTRVERENRAKNL